MKTSKAEIIREYGPFPEAEQIHGVSFDGANVWFASGNGLNMFDPESGKRMRTIDVAGHAGTAFDGEHLFQIAEDRIQKVDPKTGRVLGSIPAPGGGADSGLAWAEGTLWVGQYRERKIHQVDPETGKVLRTIQSTRFVTGVNLGRWRDVARHLGRRRERSAAHRSTNRRSAGDNRDANGRHRLGAGVRRRRSVLLRRRHQRQGARRPPAEAALA
jgi:hypothetical protein